MLDFKNKSSRQKHQFTTAYCGSCYQRKTCGKLHPNFCCSCEFRMEQKKAKNYLSYAETLATKQSEQARRFRQLQLLKSYPGCQQCKSKAVDAYDLYEENRLVCQPCLVQKGSGYSSPLSFLGEQKWYKRRWKIDLVEWLDTYECLPANADCAREWLKDKKHLEKCDCLEQKAKEIYLLFSNSLRESEEKMKGCRCEESKKVRVKYIDSAGSGWIYCEKCEAKIESAGHHGIIKNRNDPKFWGLNIPARILCGKCLGKLVEEMPPSKRYTFAKYAKRGYWGKS